MVLVSGGCLGNWLEFLKEVVKGGMSWVVKGGIV
jgi:hypothetical protein